jgi:hypothetical protein
MAGILDNKKRIMDVIVTEEGRRQLSSGKMIIEFASLTDTHTFYEKSAVSGASDASSRIFLESTPLPHDSITFEVDDSGALLGFTGASGITITDGKIFSGSTAATGSLDDQKPFASLADNLLSSSAIHFDRLNVIGTKNTFDDPFFDITPKELVYDLSKCIADGNPLYTNAGTATAIELDPEASADYPILAGTIVSLGSVDISQAEPLFYDWRVCATSDNFEFLPPVNKSTSSDFDIAYNEVKYAEGDSWPYDVTAYGFYQGLSINSIKMLISPYHTEPLYDEEHLEKGPGVIPTGRICIGAYEPVVDFRKLTGSIDDFYCVTSILMGEFYYTAAHRAYQTAASDRTLKDWGSRRTGGTRGRIEDHLNFPPNGSTETINMGSFDQRYDPALRPFYSLEPNGDRTNTALPFHIAGVRGPATISCTTEDGASARSLDNNLIIQMFEISPDANTMIKLDVIECPEMDVINTKLNITSGTDFTFAQSVRKIFYIGKVMVDRTTGLPKFFNIFTLIMRNSLYDTGMGSSVSDNTQALLDRNRTAIEALRAGDISLIEDYGQ